MKRHGGCAQFIHHAARGVGAKRVGAINILDMPQMGRGSIRACRLMTLLEGLGLGFGIN
jgi:hypothetical protein